MSDVQHQVRHTENVIKKEFNHLHQLLYNDEKAMLAALNKELKEKTQLINNKMKKMNKEILSLSRTITEMRNYLGGGDIQFLQVSSLLFLHCLPSQSTHETMHCRMKLIC